MARFQLTNLQYNLIPVAGAAAAIPFALLAALLLDKMGTRFAISFFIILSISGLSLFAYSATVGADPNLRNFLLGRALFGMGYVGQIMWFSTVA